MDMVVANSAFEYIHFFSVTYLANDFPQAEANIINEYFFAILGTPDYVELVVVCGMSRMMILASHVHHFTRLKSCAKAQGFPPGEDKKSAVPEGRALGRF